VRPDFFAVGRRAMRLLLHQIESGEHSERQYNLTPTLVQRSSVGPPPG